ncbi:Guanine deaminase [Diplonema papillatum]|nr:Guanine deaminase [Diplonema papillatum]
MSTPLFIVKGDVIEGNPEFPGELVVHEAVTIGVDEDSGSIAFVLDKQQNFLSGVEPWDSEAAAREAAASCTRIVIVKEGFLVPGFIDLHHHAPQERFMGTATDVPLMQWLEDNAFPAEARMEDETLARQDYTHTVRQLLLNGTTTCVYFSTLHTQASWILARVCAQLGQRAFVGKVSMDSHSPDFYTEGTSGAALEQAERFVMGFPAGDLVRPILCPRFVPTCSEALLRGLGDLRKKVAASGEQLAVTTHVAESADEVDFCVSVASEHGGEERDFAVLRNNDLVSGCVMAHCVHLSDDELRECASIGAGIAHCPLSNCFFAHGALRLHEVIFDFGVKVGLATDVAGGYDPSMLSAIRHAVTTSLLLNHGTDSYVHAGKGQTLAYTRVVSFRLAFWLATIGGAQVLQLEDKIGTLTKAGKKWDALQVDPAAVPSRFVIKSDRDTRMDVFEKWLNLGDDRHLARVWVNGKLVAGSQT